MSGSVADVKSKDEREMLSQSFGASMSSPLEQEFQFYLDNQESLVGEYHGKFIVIKDKKVIGVYDDELTAVQETQKSHEIGTFLVQKVEPGEAAYTQTFHSRVAFN